MDLNYLLLRDRSLKKIRNTNTVPVVLSAKAVRGIDKRLGGKYYGK